MPDKANATACEVDIGYVPCVAVSPALCVWTGGLGTTAPMPLTALIPRKSIRGTNMGNEIVKTYRFGKKVVDIYGCWDKDTPGKFDFYDAELRGGGCLNLGDPMDSVPSKAVVKDMLDLHDMVRGG